MVYISEYISQKKVSMVYFSVEESEHGIYLYVQESEYGIYLRGGRQKIRV